MLIIKRCIIKQGILVFLLFCSLGARDVFAQAHDRDDRIEEKTADLRGLQRSPYAPKFASSAGLSFGYDTNVNLSTTKKGDGFEQLLFSSGFTKPWVKGARFTFNYDLGVINYGEITDASNILNHFRFGVHQKLSSFVAGTGDDLGVLYYPNNEDGNFLFHKGFLYVRQNISRKLYHQLMLEAGIKDYSEQKAIGDTISTFQNKERLDRRQSAEWSVGYSLTPKLLLKFLTRFSVNDSNARYVDFYDYKSYEFSPRVNYRLSKKVELFSGIGYLRKNYKTRVVTLTNYKEKDNIYSANAGLRYLPDKNDILTLLYSYRDNSSNDSIQEYSENVISCGWQHNF